MRTPTYSNVTVLVDPREKVAFRWKFPQHLDLALGLNNPKRFTLKPVVRTLAAGDYCLEDGLSGIERKRGVAEIWSNLFTADRVRFLTALTRLADTYIPAYLWIEDTLASFKRGATAYLDDRTIVVDGEEVWAALLQVCKPLRISVSCIGKVLTPTARRQVGANAVRLLLTDKLTAEGYLP